MTANMRKSSACRLNNAAAIKIQTGNTSDALKLLRLALHRVKSSHLSQRVLDPASAKKERAFGNVQKRRTRERSAATPLPAEQARTNANSSTKGVTGGTEEERETPLPYHHRHHNAERDFQCGSVIDVDHSSSSSVTGCAHYRPFVCFIPFFLDVEDDTSSTNNHEVQGNDIPHSNKCVQGSKTLMTRLKIAIIFNMALCHHKTALTMDGPQEQVTRQKILMKALALYKLSCQIQSDQVADIEDVHLLSILNNMGAILACLGKDRLSKQCFSRLLSYLVLHGELSRRANCVTLSSSSNDVLEGFNSNVTSLILVDRKLAAAA